MYHSLIHRKNSLLRKFSPVFLCFFLTTAFSHAALGASFPAAAAETSLRLLERSLAAADKSQNILISPQSILTALSMAESGASGKTLSEMENALGGFSVKSYRKKLKQLNSRVSGSSSITMRVSNSVWYNSDYVGLKDSFASLMKNSYDAKTCGLPFSSEAVSEINSWVNEKTNGRIPSIINRLDPLDRLILINTVYFNGKWQKPYSSTVRRTFTDVSGNKSSVNMMEGTETVYLKAGGGVGFVKPYRGNRVAFLALLPPKGMSIRKFVKKLSGEEWIKSYKKRQKNGTTVLTRLPEFRYDYSASMKNPVKKLGIKTAFSAKANFSRMTDTPVHIDDILHKANITVTKDGTEAAAATAVMMKANAAPVMGKIHKVYLNRPFVYAIIDTKTGIPLFIGAVNKL